MPLMSLSRLASLALLTASIRNVSDILSEALGSAYPAWCLICQDLCVGKVETCG